MSAATARERARGGKVWIRYIRARRVADSDEVVQFRVGPFLMARRDAERLAARNLLEILHDENRHHDLR